MAEEGAVERVERGEPMGWRRGRGRSWSAPKYFSHCTGCGERRQPRSLSHWVGPSDTYNPVLRNTATKMKTRPLWSTARPTSPTR